MYYRIVGSLRCELFLVRQKMKFILLQLQVSASRASIHEVIICEIKYLVRFSECLIKFCALHWYLNIFLLKYNNNINHIIRIESNNRALSDILLRLYFIGTLNIWPFITELYRNGEYTDKFLFFNFKIYELISCLTIIRRNIFILFT